MLRLMTGTPGSGKSYSMAHQIMARLRQGKNVVSTSKMDIDIVSKGGRLKIGRFDYVPITDISPEYLERYALRHHRKNKERQTCVYIDEAQIIFNSRDWQKAGRRDWLVFFTSHRHYGYDIYLITQHDEMLDKQIRALIEHEVKHRKVNNLLWFLPFPVFVRVETWYGNSRLRIRSEFFVYRRKVSRMYDGYMLYDDLANRYPDELTPPAGERGLRAGPPGEAPGVDPPMLPRITIF